MERRAFTPRKPDFKGFVVKPDGKADFKRPYGAIWFNDEDVIPERAFTLVSEKSPKKVRFFATEKMEQMQRNFDDAMEIVKNRDVEHDVDPF